MQGAQDGVEDAGGVSVGESSGGDERRQDELEERGGPDGGERVRPLDRLHQRQHHALPERLVAEHELAEFRHSHLLPAAAAPAARVAVCGGPATVEVVVRQFLNNLHGRMYVVH